MGDMAARWLEGPRIRCDAMTWVKYPEVYTMMLATKVMGEIKGVVLNCLRLSRTMAEVVTITLRVREAAIVVIYAIIVQVVHSMQKLHMFSTCSCSHDLMCEFAVEFKSLLLFT